MKRILTLFLLAAVMILFTALKTSCYFGSNAVMIPISTGIVKEIRCRIYDKILNLPIGFFTEERKGDIIARITGDVSEVENSIIASLSMLIKDPILIVIYFGFLIWVSPEMMIFTILFAPAFIWVMGVIGKQLKRSSLEAQALWSDTMSQVDETLGGLRVIKAFNTEKTMHRRFQDITDRMRRKIARVSIRQALAHPVSEFLGTSMLMIVLCVGGILLISWNGLSLEELMKENLFLTLLMSFPGPARACLCFPRKKPPRTLTSWTATCSCSRPPRAWPS